MSDLEITALVLSEHEALRRDFDALTELDGAARAEAWTGLAQRLEVHAAAEETLFYPLLADAGREGKSDTVDGVHDHNAIRHAVRAVDEAPAGTDEWWSAVQAAQECNAEHMAQEEREFLPAFKEAVPAERRDELGVQWLAFHDEHEDASGLAGDDAIPAEVAAADVPDASDLELKAGSLTGSAGVGA